MATYTDLFSLFNDSGLQQRVAVAVVIAADNIRTEDVGTVNHANRLLWAKEAFQRPYEHALEVLKAVLAANKAASVAAIQNATDNAIQNNVNAVIDVFATGA